MNARALPVAQNPGNTTASKSNKVRPSLYVDECIKFSSVYINNYSVFAARCYAGGGAAIPSCGVCVCVSVYHVRKFCQKE